MEGYSIHATEAVHVEVDTLNVVRHVGCICDDVEAAWALELMNDGGLLTLVHEMVLRRGEGTTHATKVKGHADDRIGHDRIDKLGKMIVLVMILLMELLIFGRGRVRPGVIDDRHNLAGVCRRPYPVVMEFERCFIAVARTVVHNDEAGGTASSALVWSAGSLLEIRRVMQAVVIMLCTMVLIISGAPRVLVCVRMQLMLLMSLLGLSLQAC